MLTPLSQDLFNLMDRGHVIEMVSAYVAEFNDFAVKEKDLAEIAYVVFFCGDVPPPLIFYR